MLIDKELKINITQINTIEINNTRFYVSEPLKMKLEETRVIASLMGWTWEYSVGRSFFANQDMKRFVKAIDVNLTSEDRTRKFKLKLLCESSKDAEISIAQSSNTENYLSELDKKILNKMSSCENKFEILDLFRELL